MTTEKLIKASNWSITDVDKLPDTSFAFVAEDGSRHFPYRDENGSAYLPLVRNALAGLDAETAIPADKKSDIKTTLQNSLRNTQASSTDVGFTSVNVIASDGETLPNKVQLLRAGNFNTQKYGEVPISASDLQEMNDNFKKGLGMAADGQTGIPIDFAHQSHLNAAGWIKDLSVEGDALFGTNIEWSNSGKQALLGKEYKMLSSDFYPGAFGEWVDAESGVRAKNVIVGAALTNRPMFTGNQPIIADETSSKEGGNQKIVYVIASQEKETSMNIDTLRVKAADDLTGPEQRFLQANAKDLTADEKKKFEIVEASVEEPEKPKKVEASSIKGDEGLVAIEAADVKALKDSVANLEASQKESEKKEMEKVVLAHVARGAIKADRTESYTTRLLAAQGEDRKELMADLEALASNPALASTQGSADGDEGSVKDARSELMNKALEKVEAARKDDKNLSVEAAMDEVRKEEPELAKQASTQGKAKLANMTASDEQFAAAGVNRG